jgi:hypothetical protein
MKITRRLFSPVLAMALLHGMQAHAEEDLVLHDGTPVRLRLSRTLSSADARSGDTIDFEVLDDVKAGDITVIPRNAVALGAITEAKAKGRIGKGGKLNVMIDYTRTVTDEKVALRGVREGQGGGRTGAMTGAIVATSLVVWPAAPFFLFMKGKDITIPKGTEITAYVNGDVAVDEARLLKKQRKTMAARD